MTPANRKHLKQLFDADFLNKYDLDPNRFVDNITSDSREVGLNTLFLARSGVNTNGANFITEAILQGACLILSDSQVKRDKITPIPILYLPHFNVILCDLLSRFYDVNLSNMTFIAVTGTNGKTSVAYMLAESLNGAYVGTIGIGVLNSLNETKNTTPSLGVLMPFFSDFLKKNISSCALEISSHALVQQRLLGLPLKTAVFTNLSHDHLDYHGTMQAYADSKYELFLNYPIQNAVVSIDDTWGQALIKQLPNTIKRFSYGLNTNADIYPLKMIESMEGINVTLATPKGNATFYLGLIGQFNVLNAMAVVGVMLFEGYELASIINKIESLSSIQGRMEVVCQSPYVVVDYAHTPDALDKALSALKRLCQGQLWCVFGCGGDRDITKRPLMGQAVEKHADVMVITNDNPRSESPQVIIEAIKQGMKSSEAVIVISDRAQAIKHCFEHALSGDVILVAGKGHEDYQIIGNKTHFFSDRKCIELLM